MIGNLRLSSLLLIVCCASLVIGGCKGGVELPPKVDIKGKVTKKGKGAKASIMFTPKGADSEAITLETKDDGTYSGSVYSGNNTIIVYVKPERDPKELEKYAGTKQRPKNIDTSLYTETSQSFERDIQEGKPQNFEVTGESQ